MSRIPEKKVRIDLDEIEAVFVDATEQPVNRPRRKQRPSYSGKKKRHTVKHKVVVARKRKGAGEKQRAQIKAVSKAVKGLAHDKKLYERSGLQLSEGVPKSETVSIRGAICGSPRRSRGTGD